MSHEAGSDSLYTRRGEKWVAGTGCISPWNPAHQNGAAVSALLAHYVNIQTAAVPMQLCRLSIDILRPVPMTELEVVCETLREGTRVQLVEASLWSSGIKCAQAQGLKSRIAETPEAPLPEFKRVELKDAPDRPLDRRNRDNSPLEFRIVEGGLLQSGPGKAWARARLNLSNDTPADPITTAAMLADTGSGVGAVFDSREWSFANMDVCLHFIRLPIDSWQYLESETQSSGLGQAIVSTRLYDQAGLFAHAHQTLFVSNYGTQKSPPEKAHTHQ